MTSDVIIIVSYLKIYALDGMESITQITSSYHAPSIVDNVLTDGCGYLSDGFTNTGNWELMFEYKVNAGNGSGFLLLPPNVTSRDVMFVQVWQHDYIGYRDPNSSIGSVTYSFDTDSWIPFCIVKENTTVTLYIDEVQVYSASISTINNYNQLYVGVDSMNMTGVSSIRNIYVTEI